MGERFILTANMVAPESELAMTLHMLRFVKGDSGWSELEMECETVLNSHSERQQSMNNLLNDIESCT